MQSTESTYTPHDSLATQCGDSETCISVRLLEEEVFTTSQIAKRLKVDAGTIRAEIRRGRLQAVKVGTDYRIFHRDLDQYLIGALTNRSTSKKAAAVPAAAA